MSELRSTTRDAVSKRVDTTRRRLLLALGAMPLAGGLPLLTHSAHATPAPTVIEGRDRWLFPGWESLSVDEMASCLKALDLMRAATEKLAAQGVRSVIVIAPLKARSCSAMLPENVTLSAAVNARYAGLCQHGAKLGLDIVDAEAALATVDPAKDTVFIRADYHWSAHSAEACAMATARRLLAGGKIGGQPGGGTKLGAWDEDLAYGDLAALLPPDKRKAIGKDHFIVRQTATRESLLDSFSSTVQVIGNSMVQPYLGFPQKLSNAIDRPVGLTWTFGNTGPWKTLLNYLESPAFRAYPPEAIVWQFNEGLMMDSPDAAGRWDATSVMPNDAWLERVVKALG